MVDEETKQEILDTIDQEEYSIGELNELIDQLESRRNALESDESKEDS